MTRKWEANYCYKDGVTKRTHVNNHVKYKIRKPTPSTRSALPYTTPLPSFLAAPEGRAEPPTPFGYVPAVVEHIVKAGIHASVSPHPYINSRKNNAPCWSQNYSPQRLYQSDPTGKFHQTQMSISVTTSQDLHYTDSTKPKPMKKSLRGQTLRGLPSDKTSVHTVHCHLTQQYTFSTTVPAHTRPVWQASRTQHSCTPGLLRVIASVNLGLHST